MNPKQSKPERWAEIVCDVAEWMDIDDIHKLCRSRGLWDEEAVNEQVVKWQKSEIRRLARTVREDATGREIELVSLERATASGENKPFYKQLMLFDREDFLQVIRDRKERRDYWQREVDRFTRLGTEKFGEALQLPLDFATEPADEVN